MQILMNAIQKNTRFSSVRKMFRTKNAQIVMSGMLKLQIQVRPPPLPPAGGVPLDSPESVVPCIAPIRPDGTANDEFGLALFRKFRSVGSGSGTGAVARPLLSYHAAMRTGSL